MQTCKNIVSKLQYHFKHPKQIKMRQLFFTIIISFTAISATIAGVAIACILISGCNSPAEKEEKAQNDAAAINRRLSIVKYENEYQADIENERKTTEIRNPSNEESIADIKARIAQEKNIRDNKRPSE